MTEQDQPREPSALSLLWKKQTLITITENISPRLARLLNTVASLLTTSITKDFSQQQKQALGKIFEGFEYPRHENSGPICRISTPGLKYYRCFTCELTRGSCLCERCFQDPKHLHHEFKMITTGTCYCDCGNQQCLKKQHFCHRHGEGRKDIPEILPTKREAELFHKEMEFLLTIGLLSKLTSDENSVQKAQFLATKSIEVLLAPCTNSFTYQRLTGQLLLQQPRKQFKIGDTSSLLHQFFWVEWQSETFYKAFAKLLCQIYSHEPVRRRIVVEYLNLHTSEERKVIWVSPLTEIDSQYFLEGKLILKLLKANAIGPLTVNYRFTSINSSAGCFIQVYRAYRIMAETSIFPEILEETLKRVDFSSFYRFAIIDRESRAAVDIVSKHFLVFLRLVMKTLPKLHGKEEAELKIIRQSYLYIKNKEEVFNYCPERTLCWTLFSHLKCTLEQLPYMPIQQILNIFGEPSPSILQEILQHMLQAYFNLLRIQNYSDYCQLTSEKFELNNANRVVAALDFICLRIALGLLKALGKQEVLPLRNVAIGQVSMLQKWVHLYRVQQIKREAITEPDAKAQIATLLQTGLFIKPQDQAAGTTIQVVAVFNNILFASESSLCEIVIANLLGQADKEKVLNIYRQYAWLHPNKNRKDVKQAIECIIDNPALVKEFIQSEWQAYSKGEKAFSYQSNLSYCSRFFNDQLTDDTMQRLRKKLTLPCTPSTSYSQAIFTDQALRHLVKYIRCFVRFITGPHIDIKQASSLSGTFNLLLQSILVLYMETRASRLKEAFLELNNNPILSGVFTDYSKIIVQTVLQSISKGQIEPVSKEQKPERPQAQRKEAARARREQMMRQIRQRQGRILEEHTPPTQPQPAQSQNIQNCIICKTGSSPQHPLSYLCNMRFTNTLSKNILQTPHPLLLITTCGHLIHEGCLAQNIDSQDEYGTDYHCFLCKQLSNLRMPLALVHPQTFTQYLLTIISVQLSGNPSLRVKEKQYTHLPTVARLIYESIIYAIYLYYFSVGRFYNNSIRPIVGIQIALLKWMTNQLHIALPHTQGKEKRLRIIQEKVHCLVYNRATSQSNAFASHCEKLDHEHVEQLFTKIVAGSSSSHINKHSSLKEIKCLQRLNFFPLPRDLRALSRQTGKCRACSRLNNRTLACFLCAFKLCADCSAQMNAHVDSHLGTTVLIDLQTGKYSYRYRNIQMAMSSLYTNYVGQEFNLSEIELPPQGEFQLSQERLEKLIDEVLRDSVQDTVVDYVREMEAAPACNVQ